MQALKTNQLKGNFLYILFSFSFEFRISHFLLAKKKKLKEKCHDGNMKNREEPSGVGGLVAGTEHWKLMGQQHRSSN